MKIPSYLRSKCPVLPVAGLGSLFTIVNPAFAQSWTRTSAPSSYTGGKTLTVNAADLADVKWLQQGIPRTP